MLQKKGVGMRLMTKKGYSFFEVSSAMQKAIRRGDTKLAGYFALELFQSGYKDYVWKRLLTVSAEDCFGIITKEIWALYESYRFVVKGKEKEETKGRIFISKAVILLSQALKSRDADHLSNFVYDQNVGIQPTEIEQYFEEVKKEPIPSYAYDVHTTVGKRAGMTKEDFFRDEQAALNPRAAKYSLFDEMVQ